MIKLILSFSFNGSAIESFQEPVHLVNFFEDTKLFAAHVIKVTIMTRDFEMHKKID